MLRTVLSPLLAGRASVAAMASASSLATASSVPIGAPLPVFAFGGAIQTRNSAKRGGGQWVQPGDIILRQRGTSWHAGTHVKMGRDHTLYAVEPGYVRFYQPVPPPAEANALLRPVAKTAGLALSPLPVQSAHAKTELLRPHPASRRRRLGRRYVGVMLARDDVLPQPSDVPRIRRLGLIDVGSEEAEEGEYEEYEEEAEEGTDAPVRV